MVDGNPGKDFDQFDSDGDGCITLEEAMSAGMTLHQFKAADSNHNGLLSKAEFEAAHASRLLPDGHCVCCR